MVILTAPEARFSKTMDASTVIARLREGKWRTSLVLGVLRESSLS